MKGEDLFVGVAGVVNRYPKGILAVMVVLAIIAMGFMTLIPTQSMSDEYMDKQSPLGIVYDIYNNRYGQDTYILLIKVPNPGDPEFLNQLLVLEEQWGGSTGSVQRSPLRISLPKIMAERSLAPVPKSRQSSISSLPIRRHSSFLTGRPHWLMSSSTREFPPTLPRILSRSS